MFDRLIGTNVKGKGEKQSGELEMTIYTPKCNNVNIPRISSISFLPHSSYLILECLVPPEPCIVLYRFNHVMTLDR